MNTRAIFHPVSMVLRPHWLTGPIFSKELRVSSRRKRNYLLRFLYIACLTFFVVLVWLATADLMNRSGSLAYRTAMMAESAKMIVCAIVLFQFVATQFLAIVMLSTSISDEIYHKTLGVLMTTPINSFQIVMGKLFSKLLQLILLLTISLPLLAIIRVFGGVPWDFILSGLCINITAVIFAGTLSLYYSISGRRSYAVILKTLLTLAALYAFVPAMTMWLLYHSVSQYKLVALITIPNPFIAMGISTRVMLTPAGAGALGFAFIWPVHCLAMFAASALILARSVKIVRRVALRQAIGQSETDDKPILKKKTGKIPESDRADDNPTGTIREIKGSPLIWKELRAPMIKGGRRHSLIGLAFSIIALVVTYVMGAKDDLLREDNTHMSYVTIFMFMGLVCNLVLSATTITTEKELRSWPLLLATTMDDTKILLGKATGVIRRCLPVWGFMVVHVLVFIVAGYINPVAILHLGLIVISVITFLTGSGLYFSSLFRRTTSAVVANLATALFLWAVLPLLLTIASDISHNYTPMKMCIKANPMVQTAITIRGDSGDNNARAYPDSLIYRWPSDQAREFGYTTIVLLYSSMFYITAGLFFGWRAKRRLRKNIF